MLTKDQQLEVWMTGALQYPPIPGGATERTDGGENAAARPPAGTGAGQPAAAAGGGADGAPRAAASGCDRVDSATATQGPPFSAWPSVQSSAGAPR
eukprot:1976974-Lingulodinium_polyedra.AAC.1